MIKELEKQIQGLQKEVAEVRRQQAALRLQPCRGDLEIREKEGKIEELDSRAKTLNGTVHDFQRKRQMLMSESVVKGRSESPA